MRSIRGFFIAILLSCVCTVEAFGQFEISETMLPVVVLRCKRCFVDEADKVQIPQRQSMPDEFYKIPEQLRESATVVLTGTYSQGRGPCILRPDGMRVWYLDSWFTVKKVYRGKFKTSSVRINKAMLPDSEYVTKSLQLEHKYLVLLRPDEETMKEMKMEGGIIFKDSLRDDEIIAIVELK